ncbi:hypothetical protein [Nonomuraea basaltis]|uniref:hypothetical protein n=1 Tax=Nonomuraea basaltis TaxID=2495887 RepID=UPI00110C46C0|nr:hypothetical protein [Nonomuraea basaltis]TMR88846.1 hypothetical protein EJK15_64015 [Nonomuraea basaltis]
MSMSFDGFVAADDISPEEPRGIGGLRLHDWAMAGTDPQSSQVVEQAKAAAGDKNVAVSGVEVGRTVVAGRA